MPSLKRGESAKQANVNVIGATLNSREHELIAYRTRGNDQFRVESWRLAFDTFTEGIDHARKLGFTEDFHLNEANPIIIETLPVLYVSRAAAGMKLEMWEQVISDCNRALYMMVCPGATRPGRGAIQPYRQSFAKALLRRGQAMLHIGLLSAAQNNLVLAGGILADGEIAEEGARLAAGNRFPIRWGAGGLPDKPLPRSSLMNHVHVEAITEAMVPITCSHMSAVPHKGKVYLFGGRSAAAPPLADNTLNCFDPISGTWTRLNVRGDPTAPSSQHREPLPRSSHCSVIWQDKYFVWGGEVTEWQERRQSEEERTLWFVDMTTPVLQWQRIVTPPKAPNPGLRAGCGYALCDNSMLVFGGMAAAGGGEQGDLWEFDFVEKKWTQLCIELRPRAGTKPVGPDRRSSAVGWAYNESFFVFGGACRDAKAPASDPPYPFNDVWRWDLPTASWHQELANGAVPAGRHDMGAAVSPEGVVYLVGGASSAFATKADRAPPCNEVLEYSSATAHWRGLRTAEQQGPVGAPRSGMAAAWVEGIVYVFGGCGGGQEYNEAKKIKLKICALCGKRKQDTGKLYQCSGCKEADRGPTFYCSEECQHEDWMVHSHVCAEGERIKK